MPDIGPTPNQARAITTRDKNLVVVAGAGAGKTRVLVERYISLLDEGLPIPSIVAITFTEKAAREMRERVRDEITKRVAQTTAPKWIKHLQEIDAAQISTIHSLCAQLLRANPVQARIDPQFQVMDEADAAILQQEVVDAVLTRLAETGGDELALYTEYESWVISDTLAGLFQNRDATGAAFNNLPDGPEALLARWQEQLLRLQQEALSRLLQGAGWQTAVDWVQSNGSDDAEDKLEVIRAQDAALLKNLSPFEFHRAFDVVVQMADRPKVGGNGRAKAWDDVKRARQMLNTLRELARDFQEKFDLAVDDDDRRAAGLIFKWRALWTSVDEEYSKRKASLRALDFGDLEQHACALLRNCADVRERYRSEFACVLVDEFQDTNAPQRDIVYALASPHELNRLFVVADGKQSIYGFRGADVSVFAGVRQDMVDCWGQAAVVPLDESFRTHRRLVQAMNYIFDRVFAVNGTPAPFEIAYEPMQAKRPSPDREPLIEVIQIPQQKDEAKLNAGDRRAWQAQELAARLQQLVDEQMQVWDKKDNVYRAVAWGDMALLFRAGTHFAIYEEAFKAAHIPYVTLAGKGYYDRAEVRDLIQLLRAIDNPLDNLALATVLRSPLYALSDETLYRLRRDEKPFRDMLTDIPADITGEARAAVEFAAQSLKRLWERARRVPILDLIKTALDDTHYLATIAGLADGERRRGNVEKLLALARRTGLVRLSEFNAYLQDLTTQEVREGEAIISAGNAVQLMSIHRAKGLEFPVVVIPDASRALRSPSQTLLVSRDAGAAVAVRDERGQRVEPVGYKLLKLETERREDAEEKRLLYVAVTRTQDYLIVSGGDKPNAQSHLAQILNALGEETHFDWGTVEVRGPVAPFGAPIFPAPAIHAPRVQTREPARPTTASVAAMTEPLAPPAVRDLYAFSPTGLEMLARDPDKFRLRFMQGAPERVQPVTRQTETAYVPAFVIGEIAHRALQLWRLPDNTPDLDRVLETYARERDLTDTGQIKAAVRQANGLLQKFTHTELYHRIMQAPVRRHEVPFVFQWQGRLIHGALDLLCQSPNGEWFVVDFKTDRRRDKTGPLEAYTVEHYGVQLALYLHAAVAQFGDMHIHVHFLREGDPVELSEADLAGALARAANALV